MPKINVLKYEDSLPQGYIPAKRINFLDYNLDTLHTIIQDHCIDKGQPIVISNMNKSAGWDSKVFSLETLKRYRGDTDIAINPKNNKFARKESLGDYIQTLQKKYKLNSQDQHDKKTPNAQTLNRIQRQNKRNANDQPNDTDRQSQQLDTEDQNSSIANQQDTIQVEQQNIEVEELITNDQNPNEQKYNVLDYTIEKVYAKDITCPTQYREAMDNFLPEYLLPQGNNDLFSFLPDRFKAENLMVYLGQDGTGTPIHRDLCGTMGHNIMTMASPGGYAEWYVVVNQDRDKLASIIKPTVHENKRTNREDRNTTSKKRSVTKSSFLESDRAWLTHYLLKNSDMKVQVILQRPGDLIVIPSRAYHQVRNVGVSVKIAWNRITTQTLEYAFEDQLPLYRIINRPEVYKCKAIVAFTLEAWSKHLSEVDASNTNEINNLPAMRYGQDTFIKNCSKLLDIYLNKALLPELLSEQDQMDIDVDEPGDFCAVKCDFCHGDVFYRYYHCDECDNYDLCMNCYVVGRSCQHVNDMKMRQNTVTLTSLIQVYGKLISSVNRVLQQQVLTDHSEKLHNYTGYKEPTLATICRRIERYRRAKGDDLNTLICTHCFKRSTVAALAKTGISLKSIFRRGPCVEADEEFRDQNIDVFVCRKCTSNCQSCQPLVESTESLADYDLVYYANPAVETRNWGAFFDFNVNQSCYYPEELCHSPLSIKIEEPEVVKKTPKRRNSRKVTEVVDEPETPSTFTDEKSATNGRKKRKKSLDDDEYTEPVEAIKRRSLPRRAAKDQPALEKQLPLQTPDMTLPKTHAKSPPQLSVRTSQQKSAEINPLPKTHAPPQLPTGTSRQKPTEIKTLPQPPIPGLLPPSYNHGFSPLPAREILQSTDPAHLTRYLTSSVISQHIENRLSGKPLSPVFSQIPVSSLLSQPIERASSYRPIAIKSPTPPNIESNVLPATEPPTSNTESRFLPLNQPAMELSASNNEGEFLLWKQSVIKPPTPNIESIYSLWKQPTSTSYTKNNFLKWKQPVDQQNPTATKRKMNNLTNTKDQKKRKSSF